MFLDFKQATPGIGRNVTSLPRDDRKNLAKCISGFGNSEGGVIIWGVECSRDFDIGDVAKAKIKVPNVHRYLSWLENAISGCTIPSHNKVRNHIISIDENGDVFRRTHLKRDGERVFDVSKLIGFAPNQFLRGFGNLRGIAQSLGDGVDRKAQLGGDCLQRYRSIHNFNPGN